MRVCSANTRKKRTYAKLTVRYCTAVSVKAETGREGDLSYSVRDLSYSGGHLGVI